MHVLLPEEFAPYKEREGPDLDVGALCYSFEVADV
jgi:hypothetical protein